MEQNFSILKNKIFTGTTSVDSDLQYVNNYYLNNTGESVEIVDSSNVRSFITNENNQKVISLYYSFLSSSTVMNSSLVYNTFTPTAEFKAIFYDDEKLADSFNSFYNSSILRGISSNSLDNPDIFKNSVQNQLRSGENFINIKQNVFHNYYFWNSSNLNTPKKYPFTSATLDIYGGVRDVSEEERLVNIPTGGEYYFINVFLTKRFSQTSKMAFEVCNNIIYKNININSVFSQSKIDLIKHEDYLKSLQQDNLKYEKSFDNSYVKTVSDYSNIQVQKNSTTKSYEPISVKLIQCFVNPDFSTNENEIWSDKISLSSTSEKWSNVDVVETPTTNEVLSNNTSSFLTN